MKGMTQKLVGLTVVKKPMVIHVLRETLKHFQYLPGNITIFKKTLKPLQRYETKQYEILNKNKKMEEKRITDINPDVDHVELEYYFFYGACKVEGRDGTWTLAGNVPPRLKLRCPTANCGTWYVIEKEIEEAVRSGKESTADIRCKGNTDYKHEVPLPACSCEGNVRLVIRPVLKE